MKIALSLLLLAGSAPAVTSACVIMTPEQATAFQAESITRFKAATVALQARADQVFVGRLATLTDEEMTPDGQQQHQAVFDRTYDIKGHYADGQALAFTEQKNRVSIPVGCSRAFWQRPTAQAAGQYFIVYALDGKLLRTNAAPMDAQAMTGNEEAAFLRTLSP